MNNDSDNPGSTINDVQPPKPPAAEPEVKAAAQDPPSNDLTSDLPAASQKPAETPTSQPVRKAPTRSKPVVAISLAILVAAGLSVAAVYGYRQSAEPAEQPPAATETPAETLGGSAEVDSVMTEIDASIDSFNETADFPEAEISDQNLGL